eukprot:8535764-Prorocentrum_lima.AAC.1
MGELFIAQPSRKDIKEGKFQQIHALKAGEFGPVKKPLDPKASGIAASLGSAAPAAAGPPPPEPRRLAPAQIAPPPAYLDFDPRVEAHESYAVILQSHLHIQGDEQFNHGAFNTNKKTNSQQGVGEPRPDVDLIRQFLQARELPW